jgi:hypothetical protein
LIAVLAEADACEAGARALAEIAHLRAVLRMCRMPHLRLAPFGRPGMEETQPDSEAHNSDDCARLGGACAL